MCSLKALEEDAPCLFQASGGSWQSLVFPGFQLCNPNLHLYVMVSPLCLLLCCTFMQEKPTLVLLEFSSTLTLLLHSRDLRHQLCTGFSCIIQSCDTSRVSYNLTHFWHYLFGDHVSSRRLRTQSHKTQSTPLLMSIASDRSPGYPQTLSDLATDWRFQGPLLGLD